MVKTVHRAATGLRSLLLPGVCVLCGAPLSPSLAPPRDLPPGALARYRPAPDYDPPLCAECASGLAPAPAPRCRRCGIPLLSECGLCLRCRAADFSFDSAWPLWRYAGPAAALVAAYKFAGRRSLAPFLAWRLAEGAARFPDAVAVAAPCSPASLRKRGWDQSALLVEELGRLGFRTMRLLERKPGIQQKTLGHEDRQTNLEHAISVRGQVPERVLLVDDVMTTGATLSACARALKASGALRVDALALAAD